MRNASGGAGCTIHSLSLMQLFLKSLSLGGRACPQQRMAKRAGEKLHQ